MSNKTLPSAQRPEKKGGKFIPALCNILGTLILVLVILIALPLSLPRFFGYEIFHVVSGSMEPAIPVDSVVYVEPVDPLDVEPEDVIAFWDNGTAVTHRVMENHTFMGEFITKGDANEQEDINPTPYSALIGRVRIHFPVLGQFMTLFASNVGKGYLLCLAACGVMFNMLAGRMREHGRERVRKADAEAARSVPAPEKEAPRTGSAPHRKRRKKKTVRAVLAIILSAAFIFSGATVAVVKHQYKVSRQLYSDAAAQFTSQAAAIPQGEQFVPPPVQEGAPVEERLPEAAPITVNFDALREVNPDVVGWIFCPDTVINYPIVQGEDDEHYLTHSYDDRFNASGAIFVEAENRRGFVDSNSIIYGHHMNDNSMFATLDRWQNQSYMDEHPVMWILTPEQDYKVLLFSSYTTSATSDTYVAYPEPSTDFENYIKIAALYSEAKADVELNPYSHYVVLSTCAYVFNQARSVVHGRMVPVSSAGGLPMAEE